MKILLLLTIVITTTLCAWAQKFPFPIGKTKVEIREGLKPFSLVINAISDTVDTYTNSAQQFIYYYKNGVCHKMQEIYPLSYEFMTQDVHDKYYKKVRGNVWIDGNNNIIMLTEDKSNNKYTVEIKANKSE